VRDAILGTVGEDDEGLVAAVLRELGADQMPVGVVFCATETLDGPVPTELKIADKWTGPQLFERLENQLCGDYLRDDRSSCGIYLLVNRGEERSQWEHPATGARLDFAGLVDALQAHASSHIANDTKVEAITVVGIDLTTRARPRDIL